MADSAAPGRAGRASVGFILTLVVIDMLGIGLAWPILPKLVQSFEAGAVADAALTYGLIASLYALAQFLFSPLIGALSDAYGRRPVLLVSQAGLALDYLLIAFAPGLWWIAAARLLGGMLGATVTTANAYMADISGPRDRARNFGLVGAAFGIGFIVGPLLGGVLGEIDLRLPFLAAAALCGLNLLYGMLVLPESLPAARRRPVGRRETNPFGALRRVTRFPALYPLLAALFLAALAQRGLEAVWVLYTDFRFGWGVREAAFSLAFVGVVSVIVQGTLVGPVSRRLGEWRTVAGGYGLSALTLAAYGAASEGWMVFPLIALHILGIGLAGPALQSICSQSVPDDEQGLLQGTLSSVNALAVILGPLAASLTLAHVASSNPLLDLPGAWFLIAAGLSFGGFLLVLLRRRLPG